MPSSASPPASTSDRADHPVTANVALTEAGAGERAGPAPTTAEFVARRVLLPARGATRRGRLLGLAIVVGVMALAGWPLLRSPQVPANVDHPYKFQQQQSFADAVARGDDPLGWTQEFSGGYPELQFYPPGASGLGAAIDAVPGFDAERAYWLVLVVAWFAPAIAAWATLVLARAAGAVTVLGGVAVGIVHFGNSGTLGGVGAGVLASRLSLAACLIAIGLFLRCTEVAGDADDNAYDPPPQFGRDAADATDATTTPGGADRRPRRALLAGLAVTTALATLMHLYFIPISGLAMAWLAWRQRRRRGSGNVRALLAAGSGVLLAGVWWIGTLLLAASTVPYRPDLGDSWQMLVDPYVNARNGIDWLVLLTVGLVAFLRTRRQRRLRPFLLASIVGPVLAFQAATIVTDLVLDIKLVSAVRVQDAVAFVLLLTAPLGLQTIPALADRQRLRLAAAIVGALWFLVQYPVVLQPSITVASSDHQAVEQARLWRTMGEGSGRVAFTSNSFLGSHVLGNAYRAAGREPVNGGPTTASPMQAHLMGGAGATSIDHIGDIDANRIIFGLDWNDIAGDPALVEELSGSLRDLGITQLVAVADSPGETALPMKVLAANPDRFRPAATDPAEQPSLFTVFDVIGADPSRVMANSDAVTVTDVVEDRRSVQADIVATEPSSVLVHQMRSPYWRVTVDGSPVDPGENRFGELVVDVGPGDDVVRAELVTPTILVVGRIAVGTGGVLILVAVLAVPAGAVLGRRRRPPPEATIALPTTHGDRDP